MIVIKVIMGEKNYDLIWKILKKKKDVLFLMICQPISIL